VPWLEFLALRKSIMREEQAKQDFEAWLHDHLNEWQQIPKPPIDDDDDVQGSANMAKAQSMRNQLVAQDRAATS
jgi:hypothetical protein